jgi:hypothetical protein
MLHSVIQYLIGNPDKVLSGLPPKEVCQYRI